MALSLGSINFLRSSKPQKRRQHSRRNRGQRRHRLIQHLESRRLLAAGTDDLAPLSDEFEDSDSLSSWMRVHETEGWNADQLHTWDIDQTQSGRMVMQPHTVVWYEDYRGPMAYKSITGDFVVTTQVHITDRDDVGDNDADEVPDDAQYSLGGIMIRTPRDITEGAAQWSPSGENYVFLSLGHGTSGTFNYEVKTTVSSNSNLELTPTSFNSATLQIARIGDSVITMRQEPGQDWVVHDRFTRPDMPDTLQVGMVSYTDWAKASDFDPVFHNANTLAEGISPDPTPGQAFNPDLTSGYEYIRYARPEVPAELIDTNLAVDATDEQLLSFLGDTPNQPTQTQLPSPLVNVRFLMPDLSPIDQIQVGESFLVEISVDDTRPDGTGVFSAFVDATYEEAFANLNGEIVFGDSFPNAQNVDLTTPGVLDELGGLGGDTSGDGMSQVLARIPMVATSTGEFTVQTNPADQLPAHEFGLYGIDEPITPDQITYSGSSLTVVTSNADPIANDDSINLFHNEAQVTVDVLANDVGQAGETLAIASIDTTETNGGSFSLVESGIQFIGNGQHFGPVSTLYTIDDGNGGQDSATLTINLARQWHLQAAPTDTNNDGATSPLDALRVINAISRHGNFVAASIPEDALAEIDYFLDVNDDGMVSPIDALQVINALANASVIESANAPTATMLAGPDTHDAGLLALFGEEDEMETAFGELF